MYARQTLQAIGPGRPSFRSLVRQCRRHRPVRFYASGRDERKDRPAGVEDAQATDTLRISRRQRAEHLSQQIGNVGKSTRSDPSPATQSPEGSTSESNISPEVEHERRSIREAADRSAQNVARSDRIESGSEVGIGGLIEDEQEAEEEFNEEDFEALNLSPEDLETYQSNPDAYLLIATEGGNEHTIRPFEDLNKLGLPLEDIQRYTANPNDYHIFHDAERGFSLEHRERADLGIGNEELDLSEEDMKKMQTDLEAFDDDEDEGQEADEEAEDEDEEAIDSAPSLQHDLHMLEQYDREDVTAVPFTPAHVTPAEIREQYLHSGRGTATISASNFEGVVQDRIKMLTEMRQADFRYAPDMAKKMMRGGLISFNSEEEKAEVVAAAKDYAYKLNKSANKARKGEEGVTEHEFAPLPQATQDAILARYVRGRYWDMEKKRFKSEVLNRVSVNVAKNNTYLGRDGAVFLKKVQGLVAPQEGARGKQAGKTATPKASAKKAKK